MAMPACANVNHVMQQLTQVQFNSGEQNKDMSKVRQDRDYKDTQTVISCLCDRNPFSLDNNLRNISTGVHAHSEANSYKAKAVGQAILDDMLHNSVGEYHFKRKKQIVTQNSKSSIVIDDEVVHIDPLLLFQRLTVAATSDQNLESVLMYKLCSYPPALFESPNFRQQAQKSILADTIWSLTSTSSPEINAPNYNAAQYVLDGGALLQHISWMKGDLSGCF